MELVEGRKLSISKITELLDTTRSNMSNIISEHSSITPMMAFFEKMSKLFQMEKVFFQFKVLIFQHHLALMLHCPSLLY